MTPQLNSTVAFIQNSMYVVPAKVVRVYPDGRLNLEIQEIQRSLVSRVNNIGVNAQVERVDSFILKPRTMLNVKECDPREIIGRETVPLSRPQGGSGLSQTDTDRWVSVDQRRIPLMTGFATSHIGKWFDPSKWNYKIYAKMEGFYNKILQQEFSGVEIFFPQEKAFYGDFKECFDEWFAQALQSKYMVENGIPEPMSTSIGSWNRCEILALEKEVEEEEEEVENVRTPEAPKRDKRKPQTRSGGAKASKSRAPRSRRSLSKA